MTVNRVLRVVMISVLLLFCMLAPSSINEFGQISDDIYNSQVEAIDHYDDAESTETLQMEKYDLTEEHSFCRNDVHSFIIIEKPHYTLYIKNNTTNVVLSEQIWNIDQTIKKSNQINQVQLKSINISVVNIQYTADISYISNIQSIPGELHTNFLAISSTGCIFIEDTLFADAVGLYFSNEATPVLFDLSVSDPGTRMIIGCEWDFNGDGEIDSYEANPSYTWFDNDQQTISLTMTVLNEIEVTEPEVKTQVIQITRKLNSQTSVTVYNEPPYVQIDEGFMLVDYTLCTTGEKWHDKNFTLFEKNLETTPLHTERLQGDPDEQSDTVYDVYISMDKRYYYEVTFNPHTDDKPISGTLNGANPCWVNMTFEDGSWELLHHTFNVQQSIIHDSDYWLHVASWEIDLSPYFVGHVATWRATATDVDTDDLELTWEGGDGTMNTVTFWYWDGSNPEGGSTPYDEGESSCPMTVHDEVYHTYMYEGDIIVSLKLPYYCNGTHENSFEFINELIINFQPVYDNMGDTDSSSRSNVNQVDSVTSDYFSISNPNNINVDYIDADINSQPLAFINNSQGWIYYCDLVGMNNSTPGFNIYSDIVISSEYGFDDNLSCSQLVYYDENPDAWQKNTFLEGIESSSKYYFFNIYDVVICGGIIEQSAMVMKTYVDDTIKQDCTNGTYIHQSRTIIPFGLQIQLGNYSFIGSEKIYCEPKLVPSSTMYIFEKNDQSDLIHCPEIDICSFNKSDYWSTINQTTHIIKIPSSNVDLHIFYELMNVNETQCWIWIWNGEQLPNEGTHSIIIFPDCIIHSIISIWDKEYQRCWLQIDGHHATIFNQRNLQFHSKTITTHYPLYSERIIVDIRVSSEYYDLWISFKSTFSNEQSLPLKYMQYSICQLNGGVV